MPELTLFEVSATIGDEPTPADGLFFVETNLDATQTDFDVTIDAASVLAAASRYRRVSLALSIDMGSGTLTEIAPHEVGPEFAITEDIRGYSDELTFSLLGDRWSPLIRAVLRSRRKIRLEMTYGAPGQMVTHAVFDGRIANASYDAVNLRANITAFDEAIQYSEAQVNVTVDPAEGKTRREIARDLLTANGVPVGEMYLGPAGDRVIQKSFTSAEVRLFDFLRDWLSPCLGSPNRIYFRDGRFVALPLSANQSPIATLTIRDLLAPVSCDVPATTEPNIVTGVAVRFDRLDIGAGLRTDAPIVEEISADYAIKGGVETVGGSPVDYTSSSAFRVITRIETTTTYLGATPVRTQVDTFGWYAPLAAPKSQDGSGALHDTPYTAVLKFADGNYRWGPTETFRLISRVITAKTWDADLRITGETEQRYFWHVLRAAVARIVSGTPSPIACYVMGDGQGSQYFLEAFASGDRLTTKFPDEQTARTIEFDDDGVITRETESKYYQTPGATSDPAG